MGRAIEGLAAPESGWPIDMELVYQVYRNGVLLDERLVRRPGETEAALSGLPRYDEQGNEYTYTLVEEVPAGWHCDWDFTNSIEDDLEKTGNRVTQLTGNFSNVIDRCYSDV